MRTTTLIVTGALAGALALSGLVAPVRAGGAASQPAEASAPGILGWLGPNEGRDDGWRQELVDVARTQLGVQYHSLHYGPAGDPYGNGEGFGCAMFVSYAYNNVFFDGARGDEPGDGPIYRDGFAGWTQAFWGNAAADNRWGLNPGFHEVAPGQAKPGDVICWMYEGDAYGETDMCYHVSMYEGDGWHIESNFGGVVEAPIDIWRDDIHFLSYEWSDVARTWQGAPGAR